MHDDDHEDLEPLEIKCTDTDCDNGLHCFLQKKERGTSRRRPGSCRECGADLVAWDRLRARDLSDVDYTFSALRQELIRHEFFHRRFDQKALNHARRKGRARMRAAAEQRIRTSVGRAGHPREGRQTPYRENVLYYAQHAVAACCRKCIEYWHGIEGGRELSDVEIEYLVALVLSYVDLRLPDLSAEPQTIPPIRSSRLPTAKRLKKSTGRH